MKTRLKWVSGRHGGTSAASGSNKLDLRYVEKLERRVAGLERQVAHLEVILSQQLGRR